MKTIRFTKMEGAGNDYIYIDLFQESIDDPERLAREMSHRRFGIGSDGLILIAPSQKADLRMIMYNADGSLSEMCGNGIRCVGKYAWDHHRVRNRILTIETGAGIKTVTLETDANDRVTAASVRMGEPILAARQIPAELDGDRIVNHLFDFGAFSLQGTLVSMGNPHLVTYVEDLAITPVTSWGPVIENHPLFPRRINIEFVQVVSRSEVRQRTWERGSGETLACGTGASAVCVAGVLNGLTDVTILNHLTGGDLTLTWEGPGHEVIMQGPAREVFSGTWTCS
jgi:diaminopimelate epimerase